MPGSVAEADGWGLEIQGEGNGIRAVGPIQAEVDRMLAEVDRMLAEVNQKQGGPCGHKRCHWGRGGLETSDYMLGTFRAHVHLSHNVTGG